MSGWLAPPLARPAVGHGQQPGEREGETGQEVGLVGLISPDHLGGEAAGGRSEYRHHTPEAVEDPILPDAGGEVFVALRLVVADDVAAGGGDELDDDGG